MKLEVATWIVFCLYVTGTESLIKSQHTETGGANSRLENYSLGKMPSSSWYGCLHVFHSQLFAPRNPQTEDLFRELGLWCSSTCVASSSSSVWKKLLILCDCTEECQLRGMIGGEISIGPKAKPCGVPLITYILSTPPSYFIYAFHLFF